jgi:hypothetical protein
LEVRLATEAKLLKLSVAGRPTKEILQLDSIMHFTGDVYHPKSTCRFGEIVRKTTGADHWKRQVSGLACDVNTMKLSSLQMDLECIDGKILKLGPLHWSMMKFSYHPLCQ